MKRELPGAEDLLREMRTGVAPVDPEDVAHDRRERTVGQLRSAQLRMRSDRESATRRRRRRLVVAAVLVPALAAAFAVYRMPRHESAEAPVAAMSAATTMQVKALEGRVDVIHAGRSTEAQAGASTHLEAGDGIRTAEASRAWISMPSGASVQAAATTTLALSLPDSIHRETIELELGRVDVSVPKLAPGNKFAVHTPDTTVTVHGTRFSVVVGEGAGHALRTTVAVTEGVVAVEHGGKSVDLFPGDAWSSESNAASAALAPAAPVPHRSVASHDALLPPAVRAKSAATLARTGRSEANFGDERSSTLSDENALMQRAMASARQGDDRGAVALLDSLLARYPHSILKENAEVERFRALRRLGDISGASRDAQHYLAEHPEGLGREEAQRLAVEPAPLGR